MDKIMLPPEKVNTAKSSPFFKPTIQKKLTLGSTNDTYEVEADAMANKVMRMQEPQQQNVSHTGALVQRKCAHCEQEEKLQMKPLAESISLLIQKSPTENSGESQAPSHIENQINSSKGGGNSIDHGTKNFMESRFGTDFSDVKIHTGSQAVQMSRELNAQAFTVGNDVYFNEGKYSPNSDSGKHLLAHELTHTVQQTGRIGRKIQKLGANPNCTAAEITQVHQAIFNARAWISNALSKAESSPLHTRVLPSLRRNFGAIHGVEANLPLIISRIRVARNTLGSMEVSCDTPGTTALCIANHCGWALPGSNASTICTNPPSTLTLPNAFGTECLLHESFHAAMSFMSIDRYQNNVGYPGAGSEPLINADSYSHFIRELS